MVKLKKEANFHISLRTIASLFFFSVFLIIYFLLNVEGAKNDVVKANPHPTLVSWDTTKCITCHDDLIKGKFIHSPVKEVSCDFCHEMKKQEDKTMVGFVAKGDVLCLTCHSEIEDLLTKKNIHPAIEEGCGLCHNPHSSDNPKQLVSSREEICSNCHDIQEEVFKNKHGRQPVALVGCHKCHNPHSSDEEKLFVGKFKHLPFQEEECNACHKRPRGTKIRLRAEGAVLCYACHSDKEKEFTKKSIHTPVKRGECTECHSPHLTNYNFQLINGGNKLCLGCHNKIAALLKTNNIHPPAEESCLNCHSAHASDNIFHLNEKVSTICLNCHDTEEASFKPKHYNQKGESLNCAECHNPHGSENEKLMNTYSHPPFVEKNCDSCHLNTEADTEIKLVENGGNELCYSCHDDKRKDLSKKDTIQHEAIEAGGCTTCHSPHASSWSHQLRDHTSRLCLSCHENREKERKEGKFIHPIIDIMGCQVCHDSHFSFNNNFLVEKPNQLCLECHLQRKREEPSGKEITILGKIKLKDSDLATFKKIVLSTDLTRGHPRLGHLVSGYISPKQAKKIKDLKFSGEIDCLTCHISHAGSSPFLFVDNLIWSYQVCLKCHEK
ncbi:MAG: cytochrome c3 family protein [Candidatus Aminicenantia bacterium]